MNKLRILVSKCQKEEKITKKLKKETEEAKAIADNARKEIDAEKKKASDAQSELGTLKKTSSQFQKVIEALSEDIETLQRFQHPDDPERIVDLIHCKICYEHPIQTIMYPCRHVCLCSGCAERQKDCPLCRSKIAFIGRAYLAD